MISTAERSSLVEDHFRETLVPFFSIASAVLAELGLTRCVNPARELGNQEEYIKKVTDSSISFFLIKRSVHRVLIRIQ